MKANVGTSDKVTRLALAVVAAVLALVVGAGSVGGIILMVVAAVLAVTALVGFCPIYRLVGVSTCRTK
ncbi:MAG: YgaP-like transmembrane domain [Dermatophilaceae bacterium]